MINENYVKELETFIGILVEHMKDFPFPILIKSLTGYDVLPFERASAEKKGFLGRLQRACILACERAHESGIPAKRVNEVGNYIEPFMIEALQSVGMKAEIPLTQNGIHKSTGYPDIYAEDIDGTAFYLECKTYNKNSFDTTFRSFYLSPSRDPKITKDALHLVVGFEIEQKTKAGKQVFIPVSWKLYSLESLECHIKLEFNASNKKLYSLSTKIAEGKTKNAKNNEKSMLDFM
jgi:hypothetical protein